MNPSRRLLFLLGLLAALLVACGWFAAGSGVLESMTPKASTLYYGQATCGATALTVEIAVAPDAAPQEVGVQYRLVGAQTGQWQQVVATATVPGAYLAVLPVPANAQTLLQGQPGRLEFRAYAADAQGNLAYFPAKDVQQVPVQPCTQAAVDPAQDRTPPTISQVVQAGATVYYQGACTPNNLLVSASVVDDSGRVQVALEYWYAANGQGLGTTKHLPMRAQGSVYQATIPVGQDAAALLKGGPGQLGFRIVATDAAGNQAVYPSGNAAAGAAVVQPCPQQAQGSAGGTGARPPSGAAGSRGAQPPAGSPGNRGGATPPAGGSGNNPPSGNAGAAFSIQRVQHNPDLVYFGACQAGDPTGFEVQAEVSDPARVASATLLYRYETAAQPGAGDDHSLTMAPLQGIGPYSAYVDVAQDLSGRSAMDRAVYLVEVTTTDGQTLAAGPYYVDLQACPTTGNPPAPPAAPPAPQIGSITVQPQPAYFGAFCDAGQPTILEIDAVITPGDAIETATATIGYVPQPNMLPNDEHIVTLDRVTGDAFAASVDLNDWYGIDTPPSGYLAISVWARTFDGQEVSDGVYIAVEACQGQFYTYPTIEYFSVQPLSVVEGEVYTLEWSVSGAECGVFLDGQPVDAQGMLDVTAAEVDADFVQTHQLVAQGGPCDNPTQESQSVEILIQNTRNERVSNYEVLNFGDSMDLDWAGGVDISLSTNTSDLLLVAENGAWLVYYASSGPPTIDECRAYFQYNDPGLSEMLLVDAGSVGSTICILTGEGNVGFITLDDVYADPGADQSWSGSYIQFSLRSETP